ncbi:hypothetical protein MN205_18805 [Kineococcus sp. TRM81007]|uniref:hypothetical protein n=1 Tax=Kineococcus sp. TRM81007 TaxID=2925831 RepID=UPI001F581977|nr:hypothetical protein [Kineococcus sp. TRM81007]MCI2240518.1 hypothetical protein [Kineococcus sp. TRM81007]
MHDVGAVGPVEDQDADQPGGRRAHGLRGAGGSGDDLLAFEGAEQAPAELRQRRVAPLGLLAGEQGVREVPGTGHGRVHQRHAPEQFRPPAGPVVAGDGTPQRQAADHAGDQQRAVQHRPPGAAVDGAEPQAGEGDAEDHRGRCGQGDGRADEERLGQVGGERCAAGDVAVRPRERQEPGGRRDQQRGDRLGAARVGRERQRRRQQREQEEQPPRLLHELCGS